MISDFIPSYINPKELKAGTQTNTCIPVFMSPLFVMAKS